MSHDPRVMAYTAAAIQGILAAETANIEFNARYIGERVQEIVNYTIALEDGEEPVPEDELRYGVGPNFEDEREIVVEPVEAEIKAPKAIWPSDVEAKQDAILAIEEEASPAETVAIESVWKPLQAGD